MIRRHKFRKSTVNSTVRFTLEFTIIPTLRCWQTTWKGRHARHHRGTDSPAALVSSGRPGARRGKSIAKYKKKRNPGMRSFEGNSQLAIRTGARLSTASGRRAPVHAAAEVLILVDGLQLTCPVIAQELQDLQLQKRQTSGKTRRNLKIRMNRGLYKDNEQKRMQRRSPHLPT
jgi:hypothetical protein